MEVYGIYGYIFCKDGNIMEVLEDEEVGSYLYSLFVLLVVQNDLFVYLVQVVQNNLKVEVWEVFVLENNFWVMQIFEVVRIVVEIGKI